MASPSNRLAALTFWIVGASAAIAVVGSSTLLFPSPDDGGAPSSRPGKDAVSRVVAPVFGSGAPAEPPASPPAAEVPSAPASGVAAAAAPAGVAPDAAVESRVEPNPAPDVTNPPPAKRSDDGGPNAKDVDEGKSTGVIGGKVKSRNERDWEAQHKQARGDQGRHLGAFKAHSAPPGQHGHPVAGAKSHGRGPVRSEPPRGPKHSHVRPAKDHGKPAGGPPPHARKGGKRK